MSRKGNNLAVFSALAHYNMNIIRTVSYVNCKT